jgi:hypothetical protein
MLGALTVGLKLLITIQDPAAGPCSRLLADPIIVQVYERLGDSFV